jgi:hypothetical protein
VKYQIRLSSVPKELLESLRRQGGIARRILNIAHVADVVARLIAALEPTDVVIGGGNVSKLKEMPPGCRAGDNTNAFTGGFRMWEPRRKAGLRKDRGVCFVRQRQLKMPAKSAAKSDKADDGKPTQSQPDSERYLLQIDRQSKRSFKTPEAARTAALEIKSRFCRSPFTTQLSGHGRS